MRDTNEKAKNQKEKKPEETKFKNRTFDISCTDDRNWGIENYKSPFYDKRLL